MENMTANERETIFRRAKRILFKSTLIRNAICGQMYKICMQGYFEGYTPLDSDSMNFRAPNGTLMYITARTAVNGLTNMIHDHILPEFESFMQHVDNLSIAATNSEKELRDEISKETDKLNDLITDWERVKSIIYKDDIHQEDENGRGGETASGGTGKSDDQDH